MRIVAGLLCILLIAGCSEKDKIPSGVIDKEKMEKILWDMMLADQYAANYIVRDTAKVNLKMETLKLYEEVFRLHKVTRDEFRKSFQFYQGRPDITRVMFDSLVARGNRARMENYTRPPQATTPAAVPVKPSDSAIRARSVINGAGKLPATAPGKMMTPAGKPAADTTKGRRVLPSGRPPGLFPNNPSGLPSGARPFLHPEGGRPLKAGEMPFRPVKKDSVRKDRQ